MLWHKRDSSQNYAVFLRKLNQRFAYLGLLALLFILLFYFLFWYDRFGDFLIWFLEQIGFRHESAFEIYHHGVRSYRIFYFVFGLFALFLIFLRISFRWFYHYFEAIKIGIDQLLTEEELNPLPPELISIQEELLTVKQILQERKEALILENQRKHELILYLAHDIRTPLTSILGYIDYLREHSDLSDVERSTYQDIIFEKAKRLEKMMDDFFELTKYQSGQLPMTFVEGDLTYLLYQLTDEFGPLLAQYKQTIELDVQQKVRILMDSEQLGRAFENLFKNAIVYSDKSQAVQIHLTSSASFHHIVIQNADLEMNQTHIDRLFDKFYRFDSSRNSENGGTGLGLAITKEIVEAHGGSIEAWKESNQIYFRVSLPSL